MKNYLLRRLGEAHEAGDAKPSLSTCIEAVLGQSDALLEDVLNGLQRMLAVSGRNAPYDPLPPLLDETVKLLKAHSSDVKAVFRMELRRAVYGGGSFHKPHINQVHFDDFQFLEEEQIDIHIELAVTEQEVNRSVETLLPVLNAQISSLMGWTSVQAHLNPLKPEAFVYALRQAFGQVVPDSEVRSAVMIKAVGILGAALNQLYKELVGWLKSYGIAPIASHASAANQFGAPTKLTETAVTRSLLTLDKLRRLLSGELDVSPIGAVNPDFTHTVPASFVALEDMSLVEPMIKRLSERVNQLDSESGRPALPVLRSNSDALQGRALGAELGQEVIRLMLDNLVQDRRLLDGVRQSMLKMGPLLQQLSGHDLRFFTDRMHPARVFMDRMTQRSLAFQSEDDAGYPQFQKTLNNAIHVLAAGEGDAKAFERMLRNLEEEWAQEEQRQRQLTAEAARSLMHAEQRTMLAQRLAHEFAQRKNFDHVPEIVSSFLRGPWAQVVAEHQLRYAKGSDDAEGYLALVDELIWSVQLRRVRRNRARLVALVPKMLLKIRQGLLLLDYPQERILSFFDALIEIHGQAFDNAKSVSQRDAEPELAQVSSEESDDDIWLADMQAQDSGFLTHAQITKSQPAEPPEVPDPLMEQAWNAESLHTGAWVDLALGGEWVRAQLSWASPHRTLFMFISSGGMAHSMSRRTMDRLRGLGLIRLVSDVHVMDNALDAVARTALMNDVKNAFDGLSPPDK